MQGRTARLGANAALLTASVLAALLLAEGAVRLFRPQPLAAVARSARSGWMHKPNTDLVYEREEFRIPVHFSSAGLRDREYPFHKPPGTRRIAVIGDSYVEALQVALDSTLCRRVEACLRDERQDGWRYEVMNFGVSGYGACQELFLLEEVVLRFEPDVVVAVFYHNDLDDDRNFGMCTLGATGALQEVQAPELSQYERWTSGIKSFLYQHSHLWMMWSTRHPAHRRPLGAPAPQSVASGVSPSAAGSCPGRHDTLEWRLTLRDEPEDAARAVQLHTAIWKRMDDLCRARGARFLGVLGVSATQVEPETKRLVLEREGCRESAHDLSLPNARLRAAAEAQGVAVLDLLPAFSQVAPRRNLYFRFDGHWNAAGHQVVAGALCDALLGRGILDASKP